MGESEGIAGRRVEHPQGNVCKVSHRSKSKGGEWWYLLTSDHHWDNPKCDRALLKRHMDQAVERGAGILIAGDQLCLMQGKYDKRASKSDVLPEHANERYLDSVVDTAVEWYGPYAKNILVIGEGNHETTVASRCETNPLSRIVDGLNVKHGGNIQHGGYTGWIRFSFDISNSRSSVNLKYLHGSGGGGPVTKGVIQSNRIGVYQPDANIVVFGHVHESWVVEQSRERLLDSGRTAIDTQTFACLGTYKEEFRDGSHGFHIEKGRPPKPLGGWWLRFYWEPRSKRVEYELQRAK